MNNIPTLTRRFRRVFKPEQATVLAEAITEAYSELVKTSDFNELKSIVRDLAKSQDRLAVAQERTEIKVEELAGAQQRTEVRLEELAGAQQRTEARLEELAETMNGLALVTKGLSQEVGGLSRSMGFALENEAYRNLPAYLEANHNIKLTERVIRGNIEGEEVDFFAHGERNGSLSSQGQAVCIVGESKLRLDERRSGGRALRLLLAQLENKAEAVQEANPDCEIVKLFVTHYARPSLLEALEAEGVVVVQSFDWA